MINIRCTLDNPADPVIKLQADKPWDVLAPAGLAGARYDPGTRNYVCPRHAWPNVYTQLSKLALVSLMIDPKIASWLVLEAVTVRKLTEAAHTRIVEFEAKLASRGLKLRPYQLTGILWLATHRGGLCCDDPGLGKTIMTLCAIPDSTPAIIMCPASLRAYWKQECQRWRPDLNPVILEGKGAFRWPYSGGPGMFGYDGRSECLIMSDSVLTDDYPTWPGGSDYPVYLASDEAHMFKGESSKRTQRMKKLCELVRNAYGWTLGLTGTPILNEPTELFTISEVFGVQHLAWDNMPTFEKLFGLTRDIYGSPHWKKVVSPEVRERFARVSISRRQRDVLPELPSLSFKRIPITLPRTLTRDLDALEKRTRDQLDAWEWHDIMPDFEHFSRVKENLSALKLEASKDWALEHEQAGVQVLVFSCHRYVIDALAKRIRWGSITGDTPPQRRQEIVDAFQEPFHTEPRVYGLAMTMQAGGVGFTLTNASNVLIVDRAFTPSLNHQAICRAWRPGQKNPVLVTDLVAAHPLEERIYKILTKKQNLIDQI